MYVIIQELVCNSLLTLPFPPKAFIHLLCLLLNYYRIQVYKVLNANGIETPEYEVVNRNSTDAEGKQYSFSFFKNLFKDAY